jgi:SAM-dependent methyltransferase
LHTIVHDSVADLYDIYVRTDFDIPFWLSQARAITGKTLELTCGTGRVSIPLLEAGVDLTCVDYAPGMLAQLQRKLAEKHLSCPVYCQDITQLSLRDRFDLIFVPFHSFSEIVDPGSQKQALVRIHSHLTEHGKFICSLHNPKVRTASMDGTVHQIGEFPLPQGGILSVSATMVFNPSTRIASGEQVYELFSPQRELLDRRTLAIQFYLFERAEFEQLATESGFAVEVVYGDYDCHPFDDATSPFMLWKLTRKIGAQGG